MDEHEIMAFELERVLLACKRQYPRVEAYEEALINSIKNHRELSRTYRPPLEVKSERQRA